MAASVICISHSEGADGAAIGRLLAERTGYRYADGEIIMTAARAEHVFPEAVSQAESRRAGRQLEVDFNRYERTSAVRALIRDAIVATADAGEVVIVAHAASYALAERDAVLRVLVIASDENRVRRVAESEEVDAKTAEKLLREADKGRASYLKQFYGVSHELPTHYDLVVNTDRLAPGAAVEAIVASAGLTPAPAGA